MSMTGEVGHYSLYQ